MAKIRQFRWTRRLSTGLPVVDTQHREYFNRVNEALKQADMAQSPDLFREALSFVRSYAVFHFDTEQEVMRFHDYPAFDDHLEQHHYFDKEIEGMTETFAQSGFSSRLALELYALLVDWFVDHIRTVDTEMGRFLIEEARSSAAR